MNEINSYVTSSRFNRGINDGNTSSSDSTSGRISSTHRRYGSYSRDTVKDIESKEGSNDATLNTITPKRFTGSLPSKYVKRFDLDKDGIVSDTEAYKYIKQMRGTRSEGYFGQLSTANENASLIVELYRIFDENDIKIISQSDLAKGLAYLKKNNIELPDSIKELLNSEGDFDAVIELYHRLDKNSDGLISNLESLDTLINLRANDVFDNTSRAIIDANENTVVYENLLNQVDSDNNGSYSQPEIYSILAKVKKGNFDENQLARLEEILSRNPSYNAIKQDYERQYEQIGKAFDFVDKKFDESLLGVVNNQSLTVNPSLFDFLVQTDMAYRSSTASTEVSISNYQFSDSIKALFDDFVGFDYLNSDFTSRPVDSLEIGFIKNKLEDIYSPLKEGLSLDDQHKAVLEYVKSLSVNSSSDLKVNDFLIKLSEIYENNFISSRGLYEGFTGSIQKDLTEYLGLTDFQNEKVDKYILNRLGTNLQKILSESNAVYKNLNIKDAVEAKQQIKELYQDILKSEFNPNKDYANALYKEISWLENQFLKGNHLTSIDEDILIHEKVKDEINSLISAHRNGNNVSIKTKSELSDYLNSQYDNVLSKSKRNTARHVAHNLRSPIFMPVSVI
jgi:hypothetical protein